MLYIRTDGSRPERTGRRHQRLRVDSDPNLYTTSQAQKEKGKCAICACHLLPRSFDKVLLN